MWHLRNIPQVAHFYWGNDTLSFLRYMTIYSFRILNPDWKIKLHYPRIKYCGGKTWPSEVCYCNFIGENYLDYLLNMDIEKNEVDFHELGFGYDIPENFKCDFLKWRTLSTEGGLFSDIDIIYFKPMKSLYFNDESNQNIDTMVCINEENDPPFNSVGFLMSCPNNDYYRFLHEKSYSYLNIAEYQSVGPELPNTYFRSTQSIRNLFAHLNLYNIKMELVYPLRDTHLASIYQNNDLSGIKDFTIGLHWYAGHPNSAGWENTVTVNNFRTYDNVLSKLISKTI